MEKKSRNKTHRYRTLTCGYQKGDERWEGQLWWDEPIQTTVYNIGKQQGYTIEHKELDPLSCNKR